MVVSGPTVLPKNCSFTAPRASVTRSDTPVCPLGLMPGRLVYRSVTSPPDGPAGGCTRYTASGRPKAGGTVICHFTPPCAWVSVVGVPRPSDWPGLGEGDCGAGTRLTVVWRFKNPAIASRAGAYARRAASTSRSDAATASAHLAGADLLWTGGRIRRRGVAGQSITAARSVRSCSRSGTRGLLHQRPQTREGARQPRLHGALRDSQCGGGLLAVELEEIAGCDDDPVVVAKRVDHLEKSSPLITGDDHRLGGWGRIPRAEVLGQPELEPVNPSRRTRPVASFVGDDAQEPRLQRS